MKKTILMFQFSILFVLPTILEAQERGEVSMFGGYSYTAAIFEMSKNGWDVSISANVIKHLAVVAEVSGYYASSSRTRGFFSTQRSEVEFKDYSFLFGPRYLHTFKNRWTPFVHVLYGTYRGNREVSGPVWNESNHETFSALALGGGLDIALNNRISLRAIQLDYLNLGVNSIWDRYGRFSFGAVIHLNRSSN